MWSGPRTLSTALMRSFENRPDTVVVDEPLYGYYLAETGIDHPGRDEILGVDADRMARGDRRAHLGPAAAGQDRVLPEAHDASPAARHRSGPALAGLRHAFLIRDPRRLLASYAKVRDTPTLADLGLAQQARSSGDSAGR